MTNGAPLRPGAYNTDRQKKNRCAPHQDFFFPFLLLLPGSFEEEVGGNVFSGKSKRHWMRFRSREYFDLCAAVRGIPNILFDSFSLSRALLWWAQLIKTAMLFPSLQVAFPFRGIQDISNAFLSNRNGRLYSQIKLFPTSMRLGWIGDEGEHKIWPSRSIRKCYKRKKKKSLDPIHHPLLALETFSKWRLKR